jgi:hypothetical protein
MITVLWEEQWLSTLQDLHSGKPCLSSCRRKIWIEDLNAYMGNRLSPAWHWYTLL